MDLNIEPAHSPSQPERPLINSTLAAMALDIAGKLRAHSCGTTAAKNCSGVGDSGQDGTPLGIASHGCFRLVQMWAAGDSL